MTIRRTVGGAPDPGEVVMAAGPAMVSVVDDDEAVRSSLRLLLRTNGYAVQSYESGQQLLDAGLPPPSTILLVDYLMRGMDGLALVRKLRLRGWRGRILLISGHYDTSLVTRAAAEGIPAVLEKPFDKEALLGAIGRAQAESVGDVEGRLHPEGARRPETQTGGCAL